MIRFIYYIKKTLEVNVNGIVYNKWRGTSRSDCWSRKGGNWWGK